ncbi:MAG: hypothetical protein ACOC8B_06165 [Gemmatimonadota bacterium]
MGPSLDQKAKHALRNGVEAIERVRRVFVDDDEPVIWIVCDEDADGDRIETAAYEALERLGVERNGLRVETLSRGTVNQRRRVRFEKVERKSTAGGGVRVRVMLEWRDEIYAGEASSEVSGGLIELRTGAAAAIDALESLIGHSLHLRLIGIKVVRAFDRDFMVVSLYRTEAPTGHFVGSVLVSADTLTAAVLAVLDSVNRILGNYLTTHN